MAKNLRAKVGAAAVPTSGMPAPDRHPEPETSADPAVEVDLEPTGPTAADDPHPATDAGDDKAQPSEFKGPTAEGGEGDEATTLEAAHRQIAELKAKLAQATAARPRELATAAAVRQRYRVSLPGVRVRHVDEQGRHQMRDHFEVEATSPGDAWEQFRRYNGILGTSHQPSIELLDPVESVA